MRAERHPSTLTRRRFIGSAGLTFGLAFAGSSVTLFNALADGAAFQPNAWIEIGVDNTITLIAPAAEMGQGAFTSLPMLIAEELDADWSKIKVMQAPAGKDYGNPLFGGAQVTGARRSARAYFTPLRLVGAQARRVLLMSVAERWNVPVGELTTKPNLVVHEKSGRSISYGEVATFAKVAGGAAASRRGRLEAAKPVAAHRQGPAAARYSRQGQRHRAIRHRRLSAGHALRGGPAPARAGKCAGHGR